MHNVYVLYACVCVCECICICAVEKLKSPPIYSQTNGRQDDNSQRGAVPPRWERVGFGLLSGSNGFDIGGTRAALFPIVRAPFGKSFL